MTFHVKLPMPPAANNLYINAAHRGAKNRSRIKSPDYRAWRKEAVLEIFAQVPAARRIAGAVIVDIALPVNMRGDVDGRIKPVLDALVDSKRIDDDRNVRRVTATKAIGGEDAFVTVSAA